MNPNPFYHLRTYRKQTAEIDRLQRLNVFLAQRNQQLREQLDTLNAENQQLRTDLRREQADNYVIKLLHPKRGIFD